MTLSDNNKRFMSTLIEIFSKTCDYLEGRSSLADLESWVASRLPAYMSNPESPAGQLAGLIELSLSELHDGLRTERSVKSRLVKAVHARYKPQDLPSSSGTPVRPRKTLPARHAGPGDHPC